MSGLIVTADLCAVWVPQVKPGWRGGWPCPGVKTMVSGPVVGAGPIPLGLIECSCRCHTGGVPHVLPRLADRTAVHPTDVLADG